MFLAKTIVVYNALHWTLLTSRSRPAQRSKQQSVMFTVFVDVHFRRHKLNSLNITFAMLVVFLPLHANECMCAFMFRQCKLSSRSSGGEVNWNPMVPPMNVACKCSVWYLSRDHYQDMMKSLHICLYSFCQYLPPRQQSSGRVDYMTDSSREAAASTARGLVSPVPFLRSVVLPHVVSPVCPVNR